MVGLIFFQSWQVAVVSVGDLDIGATGSYYSFSFMIFSWVLWLMCILERSI